MLTIDEIQANLDRLLPLLLAKGLILPIFEYRFRAADGPEVFLYHWTADNRSEMKSWGDFEACEAWIAAMPTPEEAALRAHNTRLAGVIDQAREDGIPDEYVAPLVVVREAISTNLLAAPC